MDSWDQPSTECARGSLLPRRATAAALVPDDWDDEDEDDEQEDHRKIWEAANNKAPMPELVISAPNATSPIVSPPPAAFQPALRILKRPTASSVSSSSSVAGTSDSQKSFAEREAQYQAARERIFGDTAEGSNEGPNWTTSVIHDKSSAKSRGNSPSLTGAAVVIRNPLGPSSAPEDFSNTSAGEGGPSLGFHRKGRPQNSP